jgi:alkaline phosphatase D
MVPNFPYRGPFHRRTIRGYDLLAKYLNSSTKSPKSTIPLDFLLFLGDFIYADVPVYIGDNQETYRSLYRRNYQSPNFRKVYERLRK